MRFATVLLSVSVVVAFIMPQRTIADLALGEVVNVRSTIPVLRGEIDAIECFSYDGLEMYIASLSSGGDFDLCVLRRALTDDDWGPPENLGPAINSADEEDFASISPDGLTLYYAARLPGGYGGFDIWTTTRPTQNDPWRLAVNLGPTINSSSNDRTVWISVDNLELYFSSDRNGGYGMGDIYVSRRTTTNGPWGLPVNIGSVVNSRYAEQYISLSPDGLLLLFCDWWDTTMPRPGGYGSADIWMARRASLSDPWEMPTNLGPPVNGPASDIWPRISTDGKMLYFLSDRTGSWQTYQVPILLNADFSGDGKVDEQDILVLREHWGQNYPPCDIGPFPWGDGIVHMEDLKVLMSHIAGTDIDWTKPYMDPAPNALEVPRDVVLKWTSAGIGETQDMYFGVSFEDVSSASRDNPLDVLISQGQTATTYDPPGLLEFGRTYYWRIDEVGGAPDFTIYQGQVLSFTTEALAYPIEGVVAASNAASETGAGPENTVNGSGLNAAGEHSTSAADMWLATKTEGEPTWIQYEFDGVYKLHEMLVWNYNSQFEPLLGFGLKDVTVEYSQNGIDWTVLGEVQLARATAKATYTHNTIIDLAGVAAKCVRLIVHSGWGTLSAQYGLSEVRFFHIPIHASQPVPIAGQRDTAVDTVLTWRGGREAVIHRVHFGTDPESVANGEALVATVTDVQFDPGPLDLGRTYYWRIDEVNEAEAVSVWEGQVWRFSSKEYLAIDDFEHYTDDIEAGMAIFDTWIDGGINGTGSTVGFSEAPFAERRFVRTGRQSMPVAYNNASPPYYSEIERASDSPQDWSIAGADTLRICFRGYPAAFVERLDGAIVISGDGTDIWDYADEFRFVYKQLDGDGSIVAHVDSLANTHGWAKAGVMIRESTYPGSTHAFVAMTSRNGASFQYRPLKDSFSLDLTRPDLTAPYWVRLTRAGNRFTAERSADGVAWSSMTGDSGASSKIIPMEANVLIGLAVTSHNPGNPTTAVFSSVVTRGNISDRWQVEAIGVDQPSNDPAPLYVTVEDDKGRTKTVAHPSLAAVQMIDWQQWMIPFSEFTSVGVEMSSVQKMSIGVGDRDNPTAAGTGLIYIDDIAFGHPLPSEWPNN